MLLQYLVNAIHLFLLGNYCFYYDLLIFPWKDKLTLQGRLDSKRREELASESNSLHIQII